MSIDNILVYGYLREYEEIFNVEIPPLIRNVLSVFCKQHIIQSIGSTQLIKPRTMAILKALSASENKWDEFDAFMYDFHNIHVQKSETYPFAIKSVYEKYPNPKPTINAFDKIIHIQSGANHTLFLTLIGTVYAVGSNDCGKLGLGKNIKHINTPQPIPFNHKIKALASGESHSLFIDEYGKLLVCGLNYCSQLGMISRENCDSDYISATDEDDSNDTDDENYNFDGDFNKLKQLHCVFVPMYNPYFAKSETRFIDVDCGSHHSTCITTNGECFTFGYNGYGNLGNGFSSEWGTDICSPHKLQMNKKFKSCASGKNHNILLTELDEVVVFGHNSNRQCSKIEQDQLETPYILSKKKEFDIPENCFIEKAVCINDKTILIVDVYRRHIYQT